MDKNWIGRRVDTVCISVNLQRLRIGRMGCEWFLLDGRGHLHYDSDLDYDFANFMTSHSFHFFCITKILLSSQLWWYYEEMKFFQQKIVGEKFY